MKIFLKNNQYKKKRVLVYGKGKTGVAAKKFLESCGAKVLFFQDGEKQKFKIKKLDFAVISPGISLQTPLSFELRNNNIPIISELQLGFENVEGKLVAITGTNGKTTTCILLKQILSPNSFYVGNAEKPLISLFNSSNENSIVVCETSSFQLESSTTFRPKISAILNLAPDHLVRHKSFENYISQKAKIFQNQTEKDFAVFNFDDEKVMEISKSCIAKKFYFSTNDQFENVLFNGAYVSNCEIFFKNGFENVFVLKTTEIKLLGKKNLENVLVAVCIAKILGVSSEKIEREVSNFMPLENRLEVFLETKTIRYINDSKATNIESVVSDLDAIGGKTVVLLGGSDKGEDFSSLFKRLGKNIVFAFLFGETREKLSKAAQENSFQKFLPALNLKEATRKAINFCKSNFPNEKVNIVLAPACASFDEFNNFEERGKCFKNYVLNGEKL